MSLYTQRIENVRTQMIKAGVEALIVPGSDPHLSEYLAEHWKIRDWLSGFNGSAGTLVITRDQSGLWTDSRYYLQAEAQLRDSGIQLFKEGLPNVPDYIKWLSGQLSGGSKVALNGTCSSAGHVKEISQKLQSESIALETHHTLAEDVWENRPALPADFVKIHPENLAGLGLPKKMELVHQQIKKTGATHYVINALDEIAWVLNLRGSDIPYNPVFHAFMVISLRETLLFVDQKKLPRNVQEYLTAQGVKIKPYANIYHHLTGLPADAIVFTDPARTNFALVSALQKKIVKKEGTGIITRLKGVKNRVEIQNVKHTMQLDGAAMVRFLIWLEQNVPGGRVTELSAARRLSDFRAENEGFTGESFATISSYEAHGAIVHYSVTPQSDVPLKSEGIYLIDSGGQYLTGTTDITRTVALGPVPEQAKTDYTLVLKGHIALATAIFPRGTRGVHLDILARQFLWNHQLNYGHGTGHGVGYFLNVHEGPQSIRPQDNGVELEAGMVTSNEPGLYRSDQYGIRIENLILTKKVSENEFGTFLAFETITLCPIDTTLIKTEMLSAKEKEWINQYHREVYAQLTPALNKEEAEWLRERTGELK